MAVDWPGLFRLANAVALIAWLILILAPRRPWLVEALRLGVAGGLATLYVGLIVTALTVGFAGPAGPSPDFSTIAGVRAIFATDGGAVTGWIHYLAFDLVAGLWIAGDADARGIGRLVQAPALVLCFLAGPAGLFIHLVMTRLIWRQKVP
ncbi:MAG: DUF4281 domain-containing protein [Sphingomonas sp.]|nr:DUF4281 domain-containing protein [Sphingomonas sp.]